MHSLFRVVVANVASWASTLFTIKLDDIHLMVMIASGLGSLAVSVVSILWIRKQILHLERKEGK